MWRQSQINKSQRVHSRQQITLLKIVKIILQVKIERKQAEIYLQMKKWKELLIVITWKNDKKIQNYILFLPLLFLAGLKNSNLEQQLQWNIKMYKKNLNHSNKIEGEWTYTGKSFAQLKLIWYSTNCNNVTYNVYCHPQGKN